MKIKKLCIIIGVLVVVGLTLLLLLAGKSNQVKNYPDWAPTTNTSVVKDTPNATPTPSPYSAEIKAKVRNEFIDTCNKKGNYALSACNCAAEYLTKNYTDSELADFYYQFHSSNSVPSEVQAAITNCSK